MNLSSALSLIVENLSLKFKLNTMMNMGRGEYASGRVKH